MLLKRFSSVLVNQFHQIEVAARPENAHEPNHFLCPS
jgi:hypothetical protein